MLGIAQQLHTASLTEVIQLMTFTWLITNDPDRSGQGHKMWFCLDWLGRA